MTGFGWLEFIETAGEITVYGCIAIIVIGAAAMAYKLLRGEQVGDGAD